MSRFRSLGFRKQMMLSYFVMVLLICFLAGLFSYQMTGLISQEMLLAQKIQPLTSTLVEVKNQLYSKTFNLNMYIATQQPAYLQKYEAQLINNNQLNLLQKTKENEELFLVIDLIRDLDFIFLNKINPLLQEENVQAINYVLKEDVEPRISRLEHGMNKSLRLLEQQTEWEFEKTNDSLHASLRITYTLSVISILFGTFCALYFRRQLLLPIQSLITEVRKVSSGTFGQKVNCSEHDEFYELAQEFSKMSQNISELFQQALEQRLVLETEKIVRQQILDSLPVGVITCHYPTSEIHMNEKAKELVILDERFFPLSPEGSISPWEQPAAEEADCWFENRKIILYHKRGGTFSALVSYAPLLDKDRETIGWIVVLTDITEQEKVQEFINQSEKLSLVGKLAAGAAHEIRNPLTVIYGFIQLLMGTLTEDEKKAYHIPLILKEIERVNQIVTEMLQLSKPSRPDYRNVTIGEIFGSILPLMKGEALLHNIEMIELYDREITIQADVEQLKQILLNLIKNGIEAMPNGGTLSIDSKKQNGMVYLSIRDTGIGISADILPHVFDPFFSFKEQGTGLGLSISMQMVKNHGGNIHIESQEGEGTTVVISLPVSPVGLCT
ncbi:ATP-binding protein [Brevibacillus massiliensis]|uniref:ATP-binding protein n=1 Tax=Brevibacillus massiliensis TaxID=1118054 RepID=UPI0002EE78C4|nr:ATP-binding protein [Brevibacillus massiliensis]